MTSSSDNFEFTSKNPEIPVKKVGIILRAFENLIAEVQVKTSENLEGANKLSVDMMDEKQIAEYLNGFLKKIQEGIITVESLHSHIMFQAVLLKAQEIDTQGN